MTRLRRLRPMVGGIVYSKYGFVETEHQVCYCPACGELLNAGPNYQPRYCDHCGQALTFDGIMWEPDRDVNQNAS